MAGTVVLADSYPESALAGEFSLTNERPCRVSPEQLYRNLFHGPLFHGVTSTDRMGEEGIEGHIQVLPRSRLFRSVPDPDFILDPILVDVATHLIGCWHLEQPDQTGRICLPFELGKIELFAPAPQPGPIYLSQPDRAILSAALPPRGGSDRYGGPTAVSLDQGWSLAVLCSVRGSQFLRPRRSVLPEQGLLPAAPACRPPSPLHAARAPGRTCNNRS